MRNLRSVVPAFATAVAVGLGGTAVALAGAGPATSAPSPASGAPVADLLAGSYQAEYGRLSVNGKTPIASQDDPSLAGKPRVGNTLSVSDGSWKPARVELSYAWYAGSELVAGATGDSLSLDASHVGDVVSVLVTASKAGYKPATVALTAGKVQPGVIDAVSEPRIKGDAEVGETLRVTPGRWSPGNVSLSYSWTDGRKELATGRSYTLKRSDRNDKLRVEVTAKRPGYRTESVVTDSTDRVKR